MQTRQTIANPQTNPVEAIAKPRPTLYMTRGLPASGKSTWSRQRVRELEGVRVNKDELRLMLHDGVWSKANEAAVLGIRNHIVTAALKLGQSVIVDDTNFAPLHEIALRALAASARAEFEIVDFTSVPLETCLKRDAARAASVGPKVILDMYHKYLAPAPAAAPAYDPALSDVIIVDVDGTVAQMNGRGPFDWARVGEDAPRHRVIDVVKQMKLPVVFVSGRDEVCREQTTRWLDENCSVEAATLLMRFAGDNRKDTIVKRELYEAHIKGKYNVMAIFDDRPQVIRLWRELGFGDRLFDVGEGREF
jgi:predicted kinase